MTSRDEILPGSGKDPVDDAAGEEVADDDLLGQAHADEEQGPGDVDVGAPAKRPELGEHLVAARDGTSGDVGEERQVDGRLQQGGGLELSPVAVDRVRQALKVVNEMPTGTASWRKGSPAAASPPPNSAERLKAKKP